MDVQQIGETWRCRYCQLTKPMTLGEMAECKSRQASPSAASLGRQGGRCAACGRPPGALPRDGDRDGLLCQSCYVLIEGARERHETSESAAAWLRAAAQYLTTREGP